MDHDGWVKLNVGGQQFWTTLTTLNAEPDSMLARMFDSNVEGRLAPGRQDDSGAYLIDRTPKYFEPILNYLRTGKVIVDPYVNPEVSGKQLCKFGYFHK
jgi:hypothetical protein